MKTNRKQITVATTISSTGIHRTGGANVVNGFYSELAKIFNVSMVYLAPPAEKSRVIQVTDGLKEYVVPKSALTQQNIRKMEAETKSPSLYDIGCFYFLDDTPQYGSTISALVKASDLVMLDRPYLFPIVHMHSNGRAIIQRSQNIEYLYKQANLPNSRQRDKFLADLYRIEGRCCNESAYSFFCSQDDKNKANEIYGTDFSKLGVLLNGINAANNCFSSVEERKKYKNKFGVGNKKVAFFIGAGHNPNIEAVNTIVNIAIECQDMLFVVAGDVCRAFVDSQLPSNVILMGRISERERKHLSCLADIALNPMYSGSGTNVKMIDYMAMGIPVMSTTFGTRGIDDVSGILIADSEKEMIESLKSFNLEDQRDLVIKNRKMVEESWDWAVITNKAATIIKEYML